MSTATQTEFGFGPDPAPQIEVLGVAMNLEAVGILGGIVIIPFVLGYLARTNLLLSVAAFLGVLLFLAAQHALLLRAGGLAPSLISFPWEYIGQWALMAIPGCFAGYLAAAFVTRRKVYAHD